MKATLIILSIIATSCMSSIMDDEYSVIDPKLAPYFESFKQEANSRGYKFDYSRFKLTFGSLKEGVGAVTDHSLNSITVDSTCLYWKIRREEMLYHEFGHLFLNRGHKDTEPSLMATKGVSYKNNRDYYINELFNGQ